MPGDPLPVYLIHWNAPEWCASAVASLLAGEGVDVELAVVDNGQRDGPALDQVLPAGTRVIQTPANRGYSGGANTALADWQERYPEAEVCLVGSHDLHVEAGALSALVEAARQRPECGVLGPMLTSHPTSSGGSWVLGQSPRSFPEDVDSAVVDRHWVSGTCMLLRRACVDDVGGFDERFGSYVEDVDFSRSAREHGWKVAVVGAARASGLGTANPDRARLGSRNVVLLQAKWGGLGWALRHLAILGARAAQAAASAIPRWRDQQRRSDALRRAGALAMACVDVVTCGHLLPMASEANGARPGPAVDTR